MKEFDDLSIAEKNQLFKAFQEANGGLVSADDDDLRAFFESKKMESD